MSAPNADPVGTVEVAARCGVSRSTVDQWRQRNLGFPEPRWTVGGRPAWDWSDVTAWLDATGRRVSGRIAPTGVPSAP